MEETSRLEIGYPVKSLPVLAEGQREKTSVDRVIALAQLVRLHNCILAAVFTFVGAYLGSGGGAGFEPAVFRAAFVVALVVGFGNAINDYCDASSDSLCKPTRALPSGRTSLGVVRVLLPCLALSALCVAATIGIDRQRSLHSVRSP